MSYVVYTTEGFILGSAPSGEASKTYWIYTKDFGLVRAKAQGVRLLASKLRFGLSEYSYGIFSFVKGREIWRITGVADKKEPKESSRARARVLSLVRRLVQGEEANEKLYAALMLLLDSDVHLENGEDGDIFELVILIHVLSSLGYLDPLKIFGVSFGDLTFNERYGLVISNKRKVIKEINRAITETQL